MLALPSLQRFFSLKSLLILASITVMIIGGLLFVGWAFDYVDAGSAVAFGIVAVTLSVLSNMMIFGFFVWRTANRLQRTGAAHQTTVDKLAGSEELFRLLVARVQDYAIFLLDPEGNVTTWNIGAERIKGYRADEIIGRNFSSFYTESDQQSGLPQRLLKTCLDEGRCQSVGLRVRKDGSTFWADIVITPLRDPDGNLRGFAKVTRDITERQKAEEAVRKLNAELEQRVAERTAELIAVNAELEAFSYSVSHDLIAPLRTLDGFTEALTKEYDEQLDEQGRHYLERIRASGQRMEALIDDLLRLSRITRTELTRSEVDLSAMAQAIAQELKQEAPQREVEFVIQSGLTAYGDERLLYVTLKNLLHNAWKFSGKREGARIEFGVTQANGQQAYFVRDNGAGFNMAHADKLFGAFQRLHGIREFEGIGIGLATVQRIIQRHGGDIWAEAAVNDGATFYFTL